MADKHPSVLTGLRGVAALWVIGYHCNIWLPDRPLPDMPFGWGFLGVDIFFVLSGFLLSSLYADLRPDGVATFWLKRICRIFPLHLAVMLVLGCVVLLLALRGHALGVYYDPASFLPVVTLTQVYLDRSGWNDPAWSISVEMACYFLLPICIPFLKKVSPGQAIVAIAALLCVDTAIIARSTVVTDGVMLGRIAGWVPLARGLVGFGTGALFSKVVSLRAVEAASWAKGLTWGPVALLGEVSFSMYLLHAPILSMAKRAVPFLQNAHAAWATTPLVLAATVMASCGTYRWIETPGRRLAYRFARSRPARPARDAAFP